MPPQLYWILCLAILTGMWLLVRGWRGRQTDDHPHCIKCDYDLTAKDSHGRTPRDCALSNNNNKATAMLLVPAKTK